MDRAIDYNNNNNNNISKAINPSVNNLHEAQNAVHVQLKLSQLHTQWKPSKQKNQRRQNNNKQTNHKKARDVQVETLGLTSTETIQAY